MDESDLDRAFLEEKLRLAAAKGALTKKVERQETALKEFKDLDNLDSDSKSPHGMTSEVDERRSAVKEVYTKMELINEILVRKLIVLNRSGGVPDVDKSMEELTNAL